MRLDVPRGKVRRAEAADAADLVRLRAQMLADMGRSADDDADPTEAERPCARTTALVETLMGRCPELRFDYIQRNARFVRDLDL